MTPVIDTGYNDPLDPRDPEPEHPPAPSEYAEGPTCPSCDGSVSEGAVTCACGAVVDDEAFWVDPMPGATFEERMEREAELERRERGW